MIFSCTRNRDVNLGQMDAAESEDYDDAANELEKEGWKLVESHVLLVSLSYNLNCTRNRNCVH
jgi:hypothetical protein